MKKLKRPISILLALLLMLSVIAIAPISVGALTSGDYEYTVSGNNATITKYNGTAATVTIPSTLGGKTVTAIEQQAFQACPNATSITIPNSITTIAGWAFQYSPKLSSVTIPSSVTSVGKGMFAGCSSLTEINVASGNTNFKSAEGILYNKDGTTLIQYPAGKKDTSFTILNTVTAIWGWSIDGCTNLTSITIPSGVASIDGQSFQNNKALTSINVDSNNLYYKSDDGILYNKGGTQLVLYPPAKNATSFTIPNSVQSIYSSAFLYCTNLQSIIIPSSVIDINNYAFQSCSSLTSITIPNSITSLPMQAFANCTNLKSVTIPASVTGIGTNAFNNCPNLVICGYSGSAANTYATSNSIPFVNISDFTYTTSGGNATITGYSGNATKLAIPGAIGNYTVTALGLNAFYNNSTITSAVIPYGVTSIGVYAFCWCTSLANVIIPDSVTSIGDYAFYNCYPLTSVNIPNGVTSLGQYTFCGCISLDNVTIPNSVTSIGGYAFCNCYALTNISISNRVTSLSEYVFSGCTSLNNVTIPDSVTGIDNYAFRKCTSLTSIVIPASVTSIAATAFDQTPDVTVYGYDSSTADTYASTNNIDFVPIVDMNNGSGYEDAALEATQTVEPDGNGFGLDKTTYNNIELLGVQSKTSSTKDIRYVAVLNEGLVKEANTVGGDIADYGFVVAKCSATTTAAATENNIKNVTKGAANTVFVSCKGTSNNLCGDYGVCDDSSTKYKYVTMTINDVDESQGFAVRFYIQTKSGRVYYANYNTDYTGCVTNYSGLTSAVA
ncbi:MAG: leucine-rich repeat domain-containing protein [Ruminococcus sp.]|nr:leucine-rich repeat domain-containing protein [Ruminococcus sp.]